MQQKGTLGTKKAETQSLELNATYFMRVIRPPCCPGGWPLFVFFTAASKQVSHDVRLKVSLEMKLQKDEHFSLYVFIARYFVPTTCMFLHRAKRMFSSSVDVIWSSEL